ncbi:hypothetical protein BKA70DRAFT_541059 [Coprinopsis sp. MPI-PUGE-AT-0042]|nr:hypothetical protein BKA70DRAFT_541059 [Coprinopsis sp. MPI-PUGE-AT-0042]
MASTSTRNQQQQRPVTRLDEATSHSSASRSIRRGKIQQLPAQLPYLIRPLAPSPSSYCLLPFSSSSRGVGADVVKFDEVCDRNWFGERGKALELAGQGQCGCGCVKLGVQGFEEMGCRVADTATESGTLNSRIRDVYCCYERGDAGRSATSTRGTEFHSAVGSCTGEDSS